MVENAEKFFDRYRTDETLRQRVAEAEAAYPGSPDADPYEQLKQLFL